MSRKIILSADGTCDIGEELIKKYSVRIFNFHIQVGDKSYVDKIEITPDELYSAWRRDGILPKTAAITPGDYMTFFRGWVADGYEIVHINLGSGLSSAHQNCKIVADELGSVYPVDSRSLSSGSGLLVCKAAEMIAQGLPAAEIQARLMALTENISATFILDTLEFMAAGGRCSNIMAIGANLLKLKPCIQVLKEKNGAMKSGKKYRGAMEKVLAEYVKDQLCGRDDLDLSRIFITSSGSPAGDFELVQSEIKKYADFKETHITTASGTISSHCGPRTMGVLFMTD